MPRDGSPMSAEHKAALAVGREEGRAIRGYLKALEENRPKRGRRRTPDSIDKRLSIIDEEIKSADPLKRVNLAQEKLDLSAEKDRLGETVDLSQLEEDFVKAVPGYSDRKGISYQAWREVGVSAALLGRAGISRAKV